MGSQTSIVHSSKSSQAAASEGASCELEGAFCGGPCTDQCSFCNVLRCESGTWQRLEVFPAPCFDCGDGLRCVAGEDYCQHAFSDVGGEPDSFECRPLPAACIGDATCACLGEELAFDMCLEPNPGELEVQFFGG